MAMPIFTKGTCKKGDLFLTFIDIMINAGWQRLNPSSNTSYLMYSDGTDGQSKMYIEIWPYDGSNVIGNAVYDIRNGSGQYSDPIARLVKDYDSSTGTWNYQSNYFSMPFFPGRRISAASGYGRQWRNDFDIDYYYYATKDVVCFVVVPFKYTGIGNQAFLLGKPSQSFMEEKTAKEYSGFIYATSGPTYDEANKKVLIFERPKSYIDNLSAYDEYVYSVVPPRSPDMDGAFGLTDMFFGRTDEGMRGRLSYFYFLNKGNLLDGDIIVVNNGSQVEKYRYTELGDPYNYATSFPTYAIAIRIE
jgi:hypothetical protein